jgi:hypothetical protein
MCFSIAVSFVILIAIHGETTKKVMSVNESHEREKLTTIITDC